MTAATTPAPAYGPDLDIAAAENASPAAAGPHGHYATHPNTTKKETPMTDQIPADEVRKIIAFYRDGASDRGGMILDALRDLLPTPPLPTLADMTPEEWDECQWMQADIIGGDEPLVITRIDWTDGTALILDRNGRLDGVPAGHVTPRPDLPRLEWPGDTPEAVPPNTLAVGSVWIGVDALTRACEESGRDQIVVSDFGGYVSVWSHDAEWWEGSTPPRTTPYTIIHTGKGADR